MCDLWHSVSSFVKAGLSSDGLSCGGPVNLSAECQGVQSLGNPPVHCHCALLVGRKGVEASPVLVKQNCQKCMQYCGCFT